MIRTRSRYELSDSARAVSLAAMGAYLCLLVVAGLTVSSTQSDELEYLLGGFHALLAVVVGWALCQRATPRLYRSALAAAVIVAVWLLKVRTGAVLGASPVGWALTTAACETAAFVAGFAAALWPASLWWQLAEPESPQPRSTAAWQIGLGSLIGVVAVMALLMGLLRYVLQSSTGTWRPLVYLPERDILLLCLVMGFFPGLVVAATAWLIMRPGRWPLIGLLITILSSIVAETALLAAITPPPDPLTQAEIRVVAWDGLSRYLVLVAPTAIVMLLLRLAGVRLVRR